jgi:hypothetical protein
MSLESGNMATKKAQAAVAQQLTKLAAVHHQELPPEALADDPLLDSDEAAKLLGYGSRVTVQRHARRRLIPFIRSGPHGEYRFRKSSLLALEIPARKTRAVGRKRGS